MMIKNGKEEAKKRRRRRRRRRQSYYLEDSIWCFSSMELHLGTKSVTTPRPVFFGARLGYILISWRASPSLNKRRGIAIFILNLFKNYSMQWPIRFKCTSIEPARSTPELSTWRLRWSESQKSDSFFTALPRVFMLLLFTTIQCWIYQIVLLMAANGSF